MITFLNFVVKTMDLLYNGKLYLILTSLQFYSPYYLSIPKTNLSGGNTELYIM